MATRTAAPKAPAGARKPADRAKPAPKTKVEAAQQVEAEEFVLDTSDLAEVEHYLYTDSRTKQRVTMTVTTGPGLALELAELTDPNQRDGVSQALVISRFLQSVLSPATYALVKKLDDKRFNLVLDRIVTIAAGDAEAALGN